MRVGWVSVSSSPTAVSPGDSHCARSLASCFLWRGSALCSPFFLKVRSDSPWGKMGNITKEEGSAFWHAPPPVGCHQFNLWMLSVSRTQSSLWGFRVWEKRRAEASRKDGPDSQSSFHAGIQTHWACFPTQSHSSFDLFIDLDIKKSSVPRTKTGHFKATSLCEENKVNIGKMIDKHQVISGLLLCKNYSGANFIIVW